MLVLEGNPDPQIDVARARENCVHSLSRGGPVNPDRESAEVLLGIGCVLSARADPVAAPMLAGAGELMRRPAVPMSAELRAAVDRAVGSAGGTAGAVVGGGLRVGRGPAPATPRTCRWCPATPMTSISHKSTPGRGAGWIHAATGSRGGACTGRLDRGVRSVASVPSVTDAGGPPTAASADPVTMSA